MQFGLKPPFSPLLLLGTDLNLLLRRRLVIIQGLHIDGQAQLVCIFTGLRAQSPEVRSKLHFSLPPHTTLLQFFDFLSIFFSTLLFPPNLVSLNMLISHLAVSILACPGCI